VDVLHDAEDEISNDEGATDEQAEAVIEAFDNLHQARTKAKSTLTAHAEGKHQAI
jgi:hypothetical protein